VLVEPVRLADRHAAASIAKSESPPAHIFYLESPQPLTAKNPDLANFPASSWSRKDTFMFTFFDPEGPKAKAPSASCLNHLKHGCTANTLFIKDENPDDFFALLEDAFEDHRPPTAQSAGIVVRTVHDQWILLRRERVLDTVEVMLHDRKPDYRTWLPADCDEINLLDRYRTTAARAYTRSLKDLQTIKKISRDDQRWQQLLETHKQKFAIEAERFKQRQQKVSEEETTPLPTPAGIEQTLYIGTDNDATVVFEVTPTNEQLLPTLTENDKVLRTYNFVGAVPTEYQHLVTPDAVTWGKSTSVQRILTFDDWKRLIQTE
jgi:hypothetical protein